MKKFILLSCLFLVGCCDCSPDFKFEVGEVVKGKLSGEKYIIKERSHYSDTENRYSLKVKNLRIVVDSDGFINRVSGNELEKISE